MPNTVQFISLLPPCTSVSALEHPTIKFIPIPPLSLAAPITLSTLFHLPMSAILQIFLCLLHGKVEKHYLIIRPARQTWEHSTIKFIPIPPLSLAAPITLSTLFHLPMSAKPTENGLIIPHLSHTYPADTLPTQPIPNPTQPCTSQPSKPFPSSY